MSYLVKFRSRTNALKFYDSFINRGLRAVLISTQKHCGLSVRISSLAEAKHVLSLGGYSSFCGIYEIYGNDLIKIY